MADIYVKHTATGANNGTSFADAYTSFLTAATAAVAGDRIFVHNTHSQSFTGGITIGTTRSNLVLVISVNDALVPTPGAALAPSSGSYSFSGMFYMFGMDLSSTGFGVSGFASGTGNYVVLDTCIIGNSTGTGANVSFGTGGAATSPIRVLLKNCTWKFCGGSSSIRALGCQFEWIGGSTLAVGTAATSLFDCATNVYIPGSVLIDGVDLSQVSTAATIFVHGGANANSVFAKISRCRLPSGWTGTLTNTEKMVAEMHACDSGSGAWRSQRSPGQGNVYTDTAVFRTAGASVIGTPLSWRMVTAASNNELLPLETSQMFRAWPGTDAEVAAWSAGQSVTATVEIINDGVTLTDAECWLEIIHFDSASSPLGTVVADSRANVMATPANQAGSAAGWTSTGLASPIKQKLSVTFTPEMIGYFTAVVKLGKPSTTVYVCPKLEVS